MPVEPVNDGDAIFSSPARQEPALSIDPRGRKPAGSMDQGHKDEND